jgi:D-galactarolactone cycloisomerase
MTIVEIRGYWLEAAMPTPIANAVGTIDTRTALLVELVDSSGHSGWGETQRRPEAAWAAVADGIAPAVLGSDAFDDGVQWRARMRAGDETAMLALSAVDIALWDLRGRIRGQPVAALLGGARRIELPAYASGPFLTPGPDPYRNLDRDADRYLAEGFTALKLRCGISPAVDAAVLARLRERLGPKVALMVDVNTGYTLGETLDLAERTTELGVGLEWIEEPLPSFDLAGYRALAARSPVPIAGGESFWSAATFQDFLEASALAVLQPDVYLCGGITGALEIAALAESAGVPVLPHVFGSTVNFQASLQVAALICSRERGASVYPWFEFDRSENPLRTLPSEPGLTPDGLLAVPGEPGLGLVLRREMLVGYTRRNWRIAARSAPSEISVAGSTGIPYCSHTDH